MTETHMLETVQNIIVKVLGDIAKIPLRIYEFFSALKRKLELRGKCVILFIDEVTRSLDRYRISVRDLVSSLSYKIFDIVNELDLVALYPVILTSDQTALEYFLRERGKNLDLYLLWNLPREGLDKLCQELHCPLDTSL